jgi:phosphoribosylformimino-5-aminoimidazole carboxamide ribotide isomerase
VILYPAIDIQDGRAVRLVQGRFEDETVYADTPAEAARDWIEAGAKHLHVVDLDGARYGEPRSLDHLREIAALGVPVQYGGGLRSIDAVAAALDAGAHRAILGTAAFRDLDFLDDALASFGPARIIVSVDVRGGNVATAGWTETTDMPATSAIVALQDRGVRAFVYTDADRDGLLEGPNLDDIRALSTVVRGRFVCSGGIGTLDHLRALRDLRLLNLSGVISGKALYERAFTVAEGVEALT